jgi:hypothetical protein
VVPAYDVASHVEAAEADGDYVRDVRFAEGTEQALAEGKAALAAEGIAYRAVLAEALTDEEWARVERGDALPELR